jgi:hypothetical protein
VCVCVCMCVCGVCGGVDGILSGGRFRGSGRRVRWRVNACVWNGILFGGRGLDVCVDK